MIYVDDPDEKQKTWSTIFVVVILRLVSFSFYFNSIFFLFCTLNANRCNFFFFLALCFFFFFLLEIAYRVFIRFKNISIAKTGIYYHNIFEVRLFFINFNQSSLIISSSSNFTKKNFFFKQN